MKTWKLEKAKEYNDGTLGAWEISTVGGTPELWHDYDKAVESAERRDLFREDDCHWRVAEDE